MSDHDQLFKTLIRRFFGDLVRIVVPDVAEGLRLDSPRFRDSEHFTDVPKGNRRQLDLVAEVESVDDGVGLVVVHVEVEARARGGARGQGMDERMWRYAMQLWLRYRWPVVPIVVYLTGGRRDVEEVTVEHRLRGRRLASYSYSAFGLGRSQAERYLDRPELLAPALAALMDPGGLSPARHKLECMRRIARAEVDDAGRFLLVNCVETYVQWDDAAQEEYDSLLAEEENQEVTTMEMTWGDRMMKKWREDGLAAGRVIPSGLMSKIQASTRVSGKPAINRTTIPVTNCSGRLSAGRTVADTSVMIQAVMPYIAATRNTRRRLSSLHKAIG
jgi:hypothetical protein